MARTLGSLFFYFTIIQRQKLSSIVASSETQGRNQYFSEQESMPVWQPNPLLKMAKVFSQAAAEIHFAPFSQRTRWFCFPDTFKCANLHPLSLICPSTVQPPKLIFAYNGWSQGRWRQMFLWLSLLYVLLEIAKTRKAVCLSPFWPQ